MTDGQKLLREHFLEPEVRGGVPVSVELKAAWKVMLDLLEILIRVCKKYDLKYSMDGGSLLGAIRHKGFIPWDDDVDVAMPRTDYDELQRVLPAELPEGVFLQSSESDPECCSTHLKLRNSNTTAIDPYHAHTHVRMNMGIFVDIFPIDPDPEDPVVRRSLFKRVTFLRGVRRNRFLHELNSLGDYVRKILGWVIYSAIGNRRLFLLREQPYSKLAARGGFRYCATLPAQLDYGERNHRETSWFDEYEEVPFEYLNVAVPKHYSLILNQIYGADWQTPKRCGAYHGELILDTKRGYQEILIEKFGYRRSDFDSKVKG